MSVEQFTDGKTHIHRGLGVLSEQDALYTGIGLFLMLLGITSILFSVFSTVMSVFFFGALLLLAGLFQFVQVLASSKMGGSLVNFYSGLLYFAVGVTLLIKPLLGAFGITLLLGLFFLVSGVLRVVSSLKTRHFSSRSGLLMLGGFVNIVLALIILSAWPISGLWLIGILVGVELFFHGLSWFFIARSSVISF